MKMKEARIRVLTNEPDYSDYQDPEAIGLVFICIWGCEGDHPYGHPGTKRKVHYRMPLLR
jgi:hypothetical protein